MRKLRYKFNDCGHLAREADQVFRLFSSGSELMHFHCTIAVTRVYSLP
jgi:hypothetical protein